jgi:thermostable 8-oxoguanine DNA glycosylase
MNLEDVFTYDCLPRIGTYSDYWKSIKPENDDNIFRRWLFAYTSIHTTWKSNVRAYNHIKNFEAWIDDKEKLSDALLRSRAGCHNIRTEYIWDFSMKFWNNPNEFKKQDNETWKDMRNRLSLNLKGIGLAKTSFALEMCYPDEVGVVCLDVHMLRALNLRTSGYRVESKKELSTYMFGEDVWLKKSKFFNSSPYILRCIFWDILQGEQSSRYWSSCFESQLCLEI